MDSDFWAMRLAAAKRQLNMQNNHHHLSHNHPTSQFDRFNMEDFEVEEEVRPDYPCPYCYEEFDIVSLCSHLEADHSHESKAMVCPVCSVKVAGGMISHITLQHGHLFKLQRRGRLRRVPFPNSQALSLLGRDLRKPIYSLEDNSTKSVASQHMWKSSFHSSLSREEREQRMSQAAGRAVFVQDLLVSTLLAD